MCQMEQTNHLTRNNKMDYKCKKKFFKYWFEFCGIQTKAHKLEKSSRKKGTLKLELKAEESAESSR